MLIGKPCYFEIDKALKSSDNRADYIDIKIVSLAVLADDIVKSMATRAKGLAGKVAFGKHTKTSSTVGFRSH